MKDAIVAAHGSFEDFKTAFSKAARKWQIKDHTKKIALALNTVGLINILPN